MSVSYNLCESISSKFSDVDTPTLLPSVKVFSLSGLYPLNFLNVERNLFSFCLLRDEGMDGDLHDIGLMFVRTNVENSDMTKRKRERDLYETLRQRRKERDLNELGPW